jgi:hypothetical protein
MQTRGRHNGAWRRNLRREEEVDSSVPPWLRGRLAGERNQVNACVWLSLPKWRVAMMVMLANGK